MATTSSSHRLEVRRTFTAPPARLFQAWTTAEELTRWHAPGDHTVALAEVDARVGGRYRIHMRHPDGREHRVSGVYRVVDPPRKLVFTWKWEHEPVESIVTLDFLPRGTGTELVLTHEGLPTDASRTSHEHGWTGIFEKLATTI